MRRSVALAPGVVLIACALGCGGQHDGVSVAAVPAAPAATPSSEPAATADASGSPAEPPSAATQAPEAAKEPAPIPKNTAVLHIGDSFVLAGFSQALKPRMKELGVRYEVRSETPSYTVTWASKIELLVQNTQPDLVIITLGANEMENTDPPTHAPAVRRIVKLIGSRPCVWVTPPSWKKDTGIIDVIRHNAAPCRFFDSDALVTTPIPRQSDKIHPTKHGGEIWASAFWSWLQAQRLPAGESKNPWALRPGPPEEYETPRVDPRPAAEAK